MMMSKSIKMIITQSSCAEKDNKTRENKIIIKNDTTYKI